MTHQQAAEDAVCELLHIRLGRTRFNVGKGKKTCIGQLYGLLYNRHKHRLHKIIFGKSNVFVSVKSGLVSKPKNWKRNKHLYFTHEKTRDEMSGKMKVSQSKEVSNIQVSFRSIDNFFDELIPVLSNQRDLHHNIVVFPVGKWG